MKKNQRSDDNAGFHRSDDDQKKLPVPAASWLPVSKPKPKPLTYLAPPPLIDTKDNAPKEKLPIPGGYWQPHSKSKELPKLKDEAESSNQLNDLERSMNELALKEKLPLTNSSKIPKEFLYVIALRSSGQYFMVGASDAVAMASWEAGACKIRTSQYDVVAALDFLDEGRNLVTILYCTCAEGIEQRERLHSLDRNLQLSDEAIANEERANCIHAKVVGLLDVQLFPCADDSDAYIQQFGNNMIWAVRSESGCYGVVKRSTRGNLSCATCGKRRCKHTNTFESGHRGFGIELPPPALVEETPPVISSERIQYSDDMLGDIRYPVTGDLIPSASAGSCIHGNEWGPVSKGIPTVIYNDRGRPYDGCVIYTRSTNGTCKCRLHFDGKERGVINVNNGKLVEHGLLLDYLTSFGRDGQPLAAFRDILVQSNKLRRIETIPQNVLYKAWTGFAELLSMDEMEGFCCSLCGRYPNTIVLDGTAISCKKEMIPRLCVNQANGLPQLHGISHKDRVFIPQKKTRDLLMQFATGKDSAGKEKLLSVDQVNTLLQRVAKEFAATPLLDLLQRLTANGTCKANSHYKLFLRELAKHTPICAIMQADRVEEALTAMDDVVGGFLDIASSARRCLLDQMRVWCPGLLECLLPIRQAEERLPGDVRGVVAMALAKIRHQLGTTAMNSDEDYEPIQGDDSSTGYFPCWPFARGRGRYEPERSTADESDTCTKHRHGHAVLGPGIVVYVCPHGVAYGFSVMESYESPRMPFDVLVSRFSAQNLPKNVIYDNACKLHLYCLRREPHHFKKTRFLVDRFHWPGHKACSIGYDMNRYKIDKTISTVNSQVNEQLNSRLGHLKRSLSFMTYKHFKCHLKLFLFLHNKQVMGGF